MRLFDSVLIAFNSAREFVLRGRVGDRRTGRARQNYGFASHPPAGSKILTGEVDNDPAKVRPIIIYNEAAAPTDLEEGEVEIYDSVSGNRIRLRNNGAIWLQNANGTFALEQNGDVSITGNLTVNGKVHSRDDVTAEGDAGEISLKEHIHIVSNSPTSPPVDE